MQKSDLPSLFYSRRSYRLLCKTFFCMRDTTYFLGSNFLCFLPDCSTQHKGSLECLLVSLSVSLGEAMSSDDRSAMSETRQCSFWYVCCSRQSLRERAYSAIASIFGVPSFTSEPTICTNGCKRGERKPTQHRKHFCQHFMRWVVSCAKTNFLDVLHPLYFSKNNFPFLIATPNSYLFTSDLIFSL